MGLTEMYRESKKIFTADGNFLFDPCKQACIMKLVSFVLEESNMFEFLINKLKAHPRKIVFTEGTDPRVLEASARLLSGTFLTPVLVGRSGGNSKGGRGDWLQYPGRGNHQSRHL